MSTTKTEVQRLADGLLAETSKFGTPSIQRGLVNGAIQELRRLDAENQQLRSQLAKAVAEERESIAKWYAAEGWLLDEDDIPAAIRARSNT